MRASLEVVLLARRLFIASSANPRLKAVRRLARVGSRELCVAEGGRAVRAALAARVVLRELYVVPALYSDADADAALVAASERRGVQVIEVEQNAFSTMTRGRPDGLLVVVERPPAALEALALPPAPFVLVAAGIERPGNLGTILRTACAAGADAAIVADPWTDVFHPDVVRGSVGAVFRLPLATGQSDEVIAWLRRRRIRIVATSPRAGTPYWDIPLDGPTAVVVGGERHGLPVLWLEAADACAAIPMPGPTDSLNVAVAAGVVLCDAVRRRTRTPGSPHDRYRTSSPSASSP